MQADWPFYMGLSLFRAAAILAGVGARAAQGNASSRIAAQVGGCWGVRAGMRGAGPACRCCLPAVVQFCACRRLLLPAAACMPLPHPLTRVPIPCHPAG